MRDAPRPILYRLFLLAAFALTLLALPPHARAAGNVTVTSRDVTEVDGRWKLNMTIDYGSIPQLPHIPMIFSFEPKVLYERALTDQSPEKPVLVKKPLQSQPTINESMDVGFSDASGKVFKVTKFDFVLRRDHGFEAGEYDLKIRRQDDGAQMGGVLHLTLKGENPIVDRRAIVFAGDKPKKKAEKKDEAPAEKKGDDKPAEAPAAASTGEAPAADPNAPPAVPPKQGGCGCRVADDAVPGSLGAALALALVVASRARRTSRRASRLASR